jgi:hypothetical protein
VSNPLTDELADAAKAELAVLFSELKRHYPPISFMPSGMALRLIRKQRNAWDRL